MRFKNKIAAGLLALALTASVTAPAAAGSVEVTDSYGTTYTIGSDEFTVKYNGEAVEFPDAQPFTDENSRTLVPVRFVAETMGAEVSWDQAAQAATITKGEITVTIAIGASTLAVTTGGTTSTVTMDTYARINTDRTFVPIRYVAEALGAWVSYSDLFNTVQIYDDVLTPEEIDRLHGYYDATIIEYYGDDLLFNEEEIMDLYPEFSYFTRTYGFENANEWKLRNPNQLGSLDYEGVTTGKTFSYGTQPDIDFAKMILAEAVEGMQAELNAQGYVTLSLRSDLSCVFASRHSNEAGTYVRGVLTVTIPENADLSYIKANYDFISNPKAGETREIDVEIYVDTFSSEVYWSEMTALEGK